MGKNIASHMWGIKTKWYWNAGILDFQWEAQAIRSPLIEQKNTQKQNITPYSK